MSQQKYEIWKRCVRRQVVRHFEKQAKVTEKPFAHKGKREEGNNSLSKKNTPLNMEATKTQYWGEELCTIVPPLTRVSHPTISLTCGQPFSKNIKWKIPKINNWQVLNCTWFPVALWNITPNHSIPPGVWICPLSSESTLCTVLSYQLLSSHLGYQLNCQSMAVLVFN